MRLMNYKESQKNKPLCRLSVGIVTTHLEKMEQVCSSDVVTIGCENHWGYLQFKERVSQFLMRSHIICTNYNR